MAPACSLARHAAGQSRLVAAGDSEAATHHRAPAAAPRSLLPPHAGGRGGAVHPAFPADGRGQGRLCAGDLANIMPAKWRDGNDEHLGKGLPCTIRSLRPLQELGFGVPGPQGGAHPGEWMLRVCPLWDPGTACRACCGHQQLGDQHLSPAAHPRCLKMSFPPWS